MLPVQAKECNEPTTQLNCFGSWEDVYELPSIVRAEPEAPDPRPLAENVIVTVWSVDVPKLPVIFPAPLIVADAVSDKELDMLIDDVQFQDSKL